MYAALRWLDVLFGKGDDGYPFWLLTVRVNILLFLLCTALVVAWRLSSTRVRTQERAEICTIAALTALAGALRFLATRPNLMDFGGIPYSRLLVGYKGYFATAQCYSLLYELTARDIEHGIFFQRLAGTLTIPLVYVLCRRLQPTASFFPATAAFLFAVYPLHILFSASDTLAVFSNFLAAFCYVLLTGAEGLDDRRIARIHYWGGFTGLALLTQVRYENVLLLLPPVVMLLVRRHTLRLREVVWPLAVAAMFGAIYLYAAATSGLSYQNPINLDRGLDLTTRHLAMNPFLAVPVLLIGTGAIWAYKGPRWGTLASLPWVAAFILCAVTIEDGHGAARIYANWLIVILPFSGYGFSLLLSAPQRLAQIVAAVALLALAALPVMARDRLAAQHLEIVENDLFKRLLTTLPTGVERIIVPDDELMWRQHHSTWEVYRKYSTILSGSSAAAQRIAIVPLTDYLSDPQQQSCPPGTCVFFGGIPCIDELMYPATKSQCDELLRTRRTSVLGEATVVAAPFVFCSIYIGDLKAQVCDPATKPRHFTTYRIEE